MSGINLSLVVPCYNEGPMLKDSIKETFEILDASRFSYEIIFVDDFSQDNTKKIIEDIIYLHPDKKITKIFHEKNTGRGQAVMDGIKIAKGKIVGFIDIDLETHARYIPSCILAIENGFDIAIAHRIYKVTLRSLIRFFVNRGCILLKKVLFKVNLPDTEAGYKFFVREKILPIINEVNDQGWFWDTEIMVRAYFKGYKIKEIPCLFIKNVHKKSTVRLIPDAIDYFRKILRFKKIMREAIARIS